MCGMDLPRLVSEVSIRTGWKPQSDVRVLRNLICLSGMWIACRLPFVRMMFRPFSRFRFLSLNWTASSEEGTNQDYLPVGIHIRVASLGPGECPFCLSVVETPCTPFKIVWMRWKHCALVVFPMLSSLAPPPLLLIG
ncbi:hypothetical protein V6N12_066820 [Hibiscus sabdariffa]|uniref:Uncharacterized protein n=1 Tax=Hibiscus sabdariffa TaxID=183260 RepID=A0ABR2C9K5_9ROSI